MATDMVCDPRACRVGANVDTHLAAQISIVQNLTYFEHLSEPMAEFLHILAEQYDYPQLSGEILTELSNKEFNSNDTKGPKSVSAFMVKLSELAPRLVIKQMTIIAKQLDSEVCVDAPAFEVFANAQLSHIRCDALLLRFAATFLRT